MNNARELEAKGIYPTQPVGPANPCLFEIVDDQEAARRIEAEDRARLAGLKQRGASSPCLIAAALK